MNKKYTYTPIHHIKFQFKKDLSGFSSEDQKVILHNCQVLLDEFQKDHPDEKNLPNLEGIFLRAIFIARKDSKN